MPKSARPSRRRHANTLQTRARGNLVDRLLDLPQLARVIPQLQPELLHQIVQHCGLEDCAELVALATPAQLERVFDLDLWRSPTPGADEHFDAARFGVWLEVLVDAGPQVAAHKLSQMSVDLVSAGIGRHARVFDRGAITPYTTLDGEEITPIRRLGDRLACDIGGYRVVAQRTDSWEAIVAALIALDAQHQDYFRELMEGCVELSNSKPEVDGLDDLLDAEEQATFDVAFDREQRQEKQGYVTPAQARAFLQMSRERVAAPAKGDGNPIAQAYFRGLDHMPASEQQSHLLAAGLEPPAAATKEAVAAVVDVLVDAGVIARPRALLTAATGHSNRLARIHAQLEYVLERDPLLSSTRSEELGFLANALASGCSILARPLSVREASDAAIAICNLGIENWPVESEDLLVRHDLVSVFQAGWRHLHREVTLSTAEHLIGVLADLQHDDVETQNGLDVLRMELTRHWRAGTPWRARDAMDAIALVNMPVWAALLALIDECPVMHAAIAALRNPRARAIGASDFEFISENSQIQVVREFVHSLRKLLR